MQKSTKSRFKLREFLSVTVLSTLGLIVTSFQIYGSNLNQEIKILERQNEVLGVVSGKDGYRLRYNTTTNGGLIYTGNSLCLSDVSASYGSCGTFVTTDTKLRDNEFTPTTSGTTSDWTKNSSSSTVSLPDKAEVLYAELIWGGSYKYLDNDVSSQLDNAINLRTPKKTVSVKPDPVTSADIATNLTYVRTKEITNIIKEGGSGVYTVGSVPAIMVKDNPYNNFVGYTIAIAYRNPAEPARNISIFTGSEKVGRYELTNTVEVKGFATPSSGQVQGKLFVSSGEGDHMYSGDRMRFGRDKNTLSDLSGPNNRVDNFFASQINGADGRQDTRGTFGTKNQRVGRDNQGAVRQGWDVTGVDISNRLSNNQTAAYAQGYSTGDGYVINSLGVQIDVNSAYPEVQIGMPGDPKICVGDVITVEMMVTNKGSANSQNTKVTVAPLEKGMNVVPGSMQIDGGSPTNFNSVINLGTLAPKESKKITFKVEYAQENPAALKVDTKVDYNYEMIGGSIITDSLESTKTFTKSTTCGQKFPPVANDDKASTKQNSSVIVDVVANDTDSEGKLDSGSLKIVNQPTNGLVEIKDGKVTFTPNKDYSGEDKFTYEICDIDKLCDTAEVTIGISPIYPPVAIDDSKNATKNTPVTINVLDNDTDVDSVKANWTYKIVKLPENGKASFDGENVIYTGNPEFTGTDKFTYEICDSDKLCDTAEVTITIPEDMKKLPPIAGDDKASTSSETPVSIDIIKNDSDSDGTLDLTTIKVISKPEKGVIEIRNGEVVYTPNKDHSGNDKFTYEICDNDKLCDVAEVNINTIAVNTVEPTAPVSQSISAKNDTYTTKTNTPINVMDILKNDNVPNARTVTLVQLPKNGSVVVNPDLTIKYTPNPGFNGKDNLTYQVCNQGGCTTAQVEITVEPLGRVLGDIENLIRTGGDATSRLWFFAIATLIGLGGVVISLRNPIKE